MESIKMKQSVLLVLCIYIVFTGKFSSFSILEDLLLFTEDFFLTGIQEFMLEIKVVLDFVVFWQRMKWGQIFPFNWIEFHWIHFGKGFLLLKKTVVFPKKRKYFSIFSFKYSLQQRTCAYFPKTNVALDDFGKKSDALSLARSVFLGRQRRRQWT